MPITTYTELKSAVADWLLRDDLTAVLPSFISLAEAGLNRQARHWRMEKRSSATLDSQYSALPADFLQPIRLSLTSGTTFELELASQADIVDMRSLAANNTGRPRYYALTAGEIEVFPTPGDNYTLELAYVARVPALSDSNADNWLLTYYPDAYLYGTLLQAAPYLKDDERVGLWKSLYDGAVSGIIADGERAKFGGSGLRVKIRSY
tara:strand:- start:794 stop:1414 length:621 start_codon:yes stop_codon:yes gene_type:complete